jgi:predicted ABC-type ATPase
VGGHNIAQQDILRRYPRSIDHFWNHYRMQADTWRLYANPDKGHQIIAEGQKNNYTVHNEDLWKQATHHQSV